MRVECCNPRQMPVNQLAGRKIAAAYQRGLLIRRKKQQILDRLRMPVQFHLHYFAVSLSSHCSYLDRRCKTAARLRASSWPQNEYAGSALADPACSVACAASAPRAFQLRYSAVTLALIWSSGAAFLMRPILTQILLVLTRPSATPPPRYCWPFCSSAVRYLASCSSVSASA